MKKSILLLCIVALTLSISVAQDYSKLLVGSWKASGIEMDGTTYDIDELGLKMIMTFYADGTASYLTGDDEESVIWDIRDNVIYDPEYPDDITMTISEITSSTLVLIFNDNSDPEMNGSIFTFIRMKETEIDYANDIIGKWILTGLVADGIEMSAEEIGGKNWIEFREDGTATFIFAETEDNGRYEVRGNTIIDPDNEGSGKMIIHELTSRKLKIEIIFEEAEAVTMIFEK